MFEEGCANMLEAETDIKKHYKLHLVRGEGV